MQLESSVTLFDDNKVESKFAQLEITADGITSEVSRKVGNDEVISRINQSAEAVTIDASKVNINGVITAINNNTTTTIDGDKITTGTLLASAVKADSGTFNTANIPNLNASKIDAGDISADRMKVNSISAVNGNTGTLKINAGKLDISGVITAINNNGTTTIDGGKITTGTIQIGQVDELQNTLANKAASGAENTALNYIRATSSGIRIASANPSTQNQRMELTSSEAALYSSDNVKRVSVTANNGVVVGNAQSGHSKITNSGLTIYTGAEDDDSKNVASFGSTARIGAIANGKPRIEIGASSINLIARNSSGTDKSVTLGLRTYSSSQHMRLGSSKVFLTFADTGDATTSDVWMGMEATGSTDPYLLDLRYGYFGIEGAGSENPLSVSRSSDIVSTSYDIALNNNKAIRAMSTGSTLRDLMRLDNGNALVIGYGNYTHPATDANTWLEGYNVYLRAQQKCYANGSQITTSDKRLKKDIVPISDKFKSLFMDLQPIEYKMEQSEDKDIHLGLTAQDVEMAFMKNNISIEKYALVDEYEYPEEKTRYKALAYTEFIPMCIQMIQSQQKELETLKGELNALRRN